MSSEKNLIATSALPIIAETDPRIPSIITGAGNVALLSFVNFFTAEIPNPNTRAAYLQAWREFGKWAEGHNTRLDEVRPFMLAAFEKICRSGTTPEV